MAVEVAAVDVSTSPRLHTAQIIESKKLDAWQAILLRCCGDPKSDSWQTRGPDAKQDEASILAWMNDCILRVQEQHEQTLLADENFAKALSRLQNPQ